MLSNKPLTQKIINAIPNPIVITNGAKMVMANQNFLEFFEVSTIEQFLQEHKCVCELFQDKDGYFSLSTIDKNTLWTDYIFNSNKNHKVSILCNNNNSYIFNLSVEKINDNYFVIFTNITAVEKNEYYQDLAYHDQLTKIYNRQMFNKLYKKELENKKRHGDALSIIMLDIDHFKQVNDTYGHDIGEELRKIIDNHKNKIPHFTVSFGVTEIMEYDKNQSSIIRVDKALYQAKVKRNDVVQL